jgi:LPXTG-motif cell wall-anchored protein
MKINTVKLASSASDEDEDAGWSGIPKNFEIQVSSNGFNWTTVKTVNNTEVPEYLTLYTYNFDTIAARYIRIVSIQNYEKGSDGNKSYIQLAEMEVSYVPTEADANSEVPTPPIPGQKEDSPKTGDATTVLVFVAMITGLSSVVIIVKRRKYNP